MSQFKILVVEDEGIVALIIRRALERRGYTVLGPVATGADALATAAAGQPDLILMDISLKGNLDGIQVATQIRLTETTPIIFLTAFTDEETMRRARLTAPAGYIIKPFEVETLVAEVETALHPA